jgi:hypothetical protein
MPTAARRGAIVDIPLPAEDRRVPSVVGGDDRVTATRQVIGQDRGEDMVVLGDLSSATCLRRRGSSCDNSKARQAITASRADTVAERGQVRLPEPLHRGLHLEPSVLHLHRLHQLQICTGSPRRSRRCGARIPVCCCLATLA